MLFSPSWRKLFIVVIFLRISHSSSANDIKLLPDNVMLTRWGKQVLAGANDSEYPRPQMRREKWVDLNGSWDFMTADVEAAPPSTWTNTIRVPFPVESYLSGVGHRTSSDEVYWYRKFFGCPELGDKGRLLLHFGAVNWDALVYVNGKVVGEHKGGYTPFSFDITDFIKPGPRQELSVSVWNPVEDGSEPRGKQSRHPTRFTYTPASGIWQTVWLEAVPANWIDRLIITPQKTLDGLSVTVVPGNSNHVGNVKILMSDGSGVVATASGKTAEKLLLRPTVAKVWSPEKPFLYDLTVSLDGVDHVESYAGIRNVEVIQDEQGISRLYLNGIPYFEYGVLDQGYWPDGIYTAPTDDALRYDIQEVKRMGFNLIRKHEKVEPARWYYWCDKIGILVWQDIPAGSDGGADGRVNFKKEAKEMMDFCRNYPSIIMWNMFNSAEEIQNLGVGEIKKTVEWARDYDSSRLIDGAGGKWTWIGDGIDSVNDRHSFPWPAMNRQEASRASVVGEFGGMDKSILNHTWTKRSVQNFMPEYEDFGAHYAQLLKPLNFLRWNGLSAAVYVELTDVENEKNGLLTYDREVNKLGDEWLRATNSLLFKPAPKIRNLVGGQIPWQYTTNEPGAEWMSAAFDDKDWKVGEEPFDSANDGNTQKTVWKSDHIWLRRKFDSPDRSGKMHICVWNFARAHVQVSLNSIPLPELSSPFPQSFRSIEISTNDLAGNGTNILTVAALRAPGAADGTFAISVIAEVNRSNDTPHVVGQAHVN